ncbi:MAG: hypothetical protein AB7G93_05015 [Bdellovibrionales bacterium]
MGILSIRTLITSLIILGMAVAVGCGDGKGKKRARVNKDIPSDKQKKPQGGTGGTGGPATPAGTGGTGGPATPGSTSGTGGPATPGSTSGTGGPATPAGPATTVAGGAPGSQTVIMKPDQTEIINQINGAAEELSRGSLTVHSDLEPGTYKLTSLATHVKYMKGGERQILNSYMVNEERNEFDTPDVRTGGNLDVEPDKGRSIEIPMKFIVKKENGQAWTPSREENGGVVLTTLAEKTKISNKFREAATNDTVPSLMQILATDGRADKSYQRQTEDSRVLHLKIVKVNDTQIRIKISILEIGSESQANKDNAYLQRNIWLTYEVAKEAAAAGQ